MNGLKRVSLKEVANGDFFYMASGKRFGKRHRVADQPLIKNGKIEVINNDDKYVMVNQDQTVMIYV